MNCNCGISVDFPTGNNTNVDFPTGNDINVDFPVGDDININFPQQCSNIDVDYCGVEIPISNVVFVNELPLRGEKDQLYVCGMSIYRWNKDTSKFVCIAGENFMDEYFTDPMKVIIFDGGNADVTLAILDDTVLL